MLRDILNKAEASIPNFERVDNQRVVVAEGNLYFQSTTGDSWFIITNAIETDIKFEIPYKLLQLVSTVNPSKIEVIDDVSNRLRFIGNKTSMDIGVFPFVEIPRLDIPDDSNFINVDLLYKAGWPNNIPGPDVVASSIYKHDEDTAIYVTQTVRKLYGLILRNEYARTVIDADLSRIQNILATDLNKIYIDNMKLYTKTEDGDSKIYSCIKIGRSLLSPRAVDFIEYIVDDRFITDDTITIRFKADDITDIYPTVDKMDYSSVIQYTVDNNNMHMHIRDGFNRILDINIPCSTSRDVKFKSTLIDKATIQYMVKNKNILLQDKKPPGIVLYVNTLDKKMVISVDDDLGDYLPFTIQPVIFGH